MTRKTKIRNAEPKDLRGLAQIESRAAERFPDDRIPDPAATHPAVLLEAALAGGLLYVAESNGKVVGFASCSEQGVYLHLDEVSVHPDHGQQGIGSALVTRVIEESRDRSLRGVTLTTFEDFDWNAPFYSKLGFFPPAPEFLPEHVNRHLEEEVLSGMTGRIGMLYRHSG